MLVVFLFGILVGGAAVALLLSWQARTSYNEAAYQLPDVPDRVEPVAEGPDGTDASDDTEETRISTRMPVLALVLDDCGSSIELARRLHEHKLPLTWSIIPNLRYSREIADMLRGSGTPFLVHVPMQAEVDPDGKAGTRGADYLIGVGMKPEAIRRTLLTLLDTLPGAYGISNHRGSKATADRRTMEAVVRVLQERNLFFLDSRTSSRSIAYDTAKAFGLRTASNSGFLDNEPNLQKMEVELNLAIAHAKEEGGAIAICHLRPDTVAFLERLSRDELAQKGVLLVTLPQLMQLREGGR